MTRHQMSTMGAALWAILAMTAGAREMAAQATPAAAEAKPTSYQLIDRALEANGIDAETAHKYRVFAAFGDARLPAAYRGVVKAGEPPIEVGRVGALLSTFSAQTQAELAPFFMRPDEPGSWITLSAASDQVADIRPANGGLALSRRIGALGAPGLYLAAAATSPLRLSQPQALAAGMQSTAPIAWQTFTAVGGKVKVWAQARYPGDAAKAAALANALDADRVWSRLTGLMRREPASDATLRPNGGDGALDVYLVRPPLVVDADTGQRTPPWEGLASTAVPADLCHQARYLLINSRNPLVGNRATPGILSIAAHELFHAIALRYDAIEACEVRWVREGTATWAANWVYPTPNTEHDYAKSYLLATHLPIDRLGREESDYGTYLLPLFREKAGGNPTFMRTMWERFEQLNGATAPLPATVTLQQRLARIGSDRLRTLKGVNDALDGGFDKTWPQFLLEMWNQAPVDTPDGFQTWDQLTERAHTWGARQVIETPAGPVTKPIPLPAGLDGSTSTTIMPLSGVFTHFAFTPDVRHVVFVNTIAETAHEHKSVWGIQKIRGRWEDPKDWSEERQKAWCRDDATEDLEELVIIFGNSDSERLEPVKPEKLPELKASPTGCTAWVGTSTAETTLTSTDPPLTIVQKADATMRFEFDPAFILPGEPREYWKIVSGQITWSVTVSGACTGGRQGVQAITDQGPGDEMATLRVWEDAGTLRYSGTSGSWPGDIPTFPVNCPNQPPIEMPLHIALGWFTTDMQNDTVTNNGKTLTASFTTGQPSSGITNRMNYTLRLSP